MKDNFKFYFYGTLILTATFGLIILVEAVSRVWGK